MALTEAEEIAAVMEVLSTGRSTGRESVQDAPLTEPYGSLTLENQGGETLLYYYRRAGRHLSGAALHRHFPAGRQSGGPAGTAGMRHTSKAGHLLRERPALFFSLHRA